MGGIDTRHDNIGNKMVITTKTVVDASTLEVNSVLLFKKPIKITACDSLNSLPNQYAS